MAIADAALRFDLLLNDKTGKGAASASSRFSKLAKVGLALGAVGGAIGSSINKAAQFDKTIRIAGAAADATGDEMKSLSALALKMGSSTQFGAQGAADAMVELAKSGLTLAEQKAGALAETMNLAAAGGLELGAASTFMANALSQFGLKAEDASRISTALAGGANASTASVESLGQALRQVGPGAKTAGLSLEDTVGVLAAFDQNALKGSDAGTSLKTMLTRLVPQTDKAKNAMHKLGLDFTKANGEFVSITEIAGQLQKAFGKLSGEQRTAALSTIFGSDATRAAGVLIDEGRAGIEKYIAATKDRAALEKQVKAQTDGAAGAMKKFSSAIDSLQIALAINLLPAVSDVVGGLAGFINKVSTKVGPAVESMASVIDDKVLPVFGRLKDGIADALDGIDLSGVGTQLAKDAESWAGDMISGIRTGFDKGEWGPLGKSVGTGIGKALETSGQLAITFFAWVGKQIKKVDWIGLGIDMGKQAPLLIAGLAIGILNVDLGALLTGLGDHWFEVIIGLLAIAFIPTKFIGAVTRLLAKIPFAGKFLSWFVGAIHGASRGIVGAAGDLLAAFGRGILTGIEKVFPSIGGKFTGAISKLIYELRFKGLLFLETARGWIAKLLGGLASAPGRLAEAAGKLVGGFLGGLAKAALKVDAWAGGFGARIVAKVGKLAKSLYQHGLDFIQGFINGIISKAASLPGVIKDKVVGVAKSALHGFGLFGSPSKLTMKYGRWWSEGFAIGMTDGAAEIKAGTDALVDKLRDQLQEVRDFAKGIRDAFASFGNITSIDTLLRDAEGKESEGGFASLLDQLKSKVAAAQQFASTLRQLRKAGLNETSLANLRDAGPEGGLKAAQTLLSGGAGGISEVNSLVKQLTLTAKTFAEQEAKKRYGYGTAGPNMATIKGGGTKVQIHFDLAGGGGDKFIQAIREAIRVKGGNVQVVLGSKK